MEGVPVGEAGMEGVPVIERVPEGEVVAEGGRSTHLSCRRRASADEW